MPRSFAAIETKSECFRMHGDLFWFNHIHLIPTRYDLGVVLTTQERDYELYNAYRTQSHTLDSIVKNNVAGLTFVGEPTNSPNVLGPLSGFVVTVTVDPSGPVTINATIDYTFNALSLTKTLTITGSRTVIMATPPDANIVESWEWLTDIIEADSGDEQRISVRDVPRQTFTYKFLREDADLAPLLNQIWGWHELIWALPIWTDYTFLTSDISAGSTSIPVETTANRDFRVGDLALVWQDEFNFEAGEIVTINASSIDVLQPTLAAFTAPAYVMPISLAKFPRGVDIKNWNVNARELTARWQVLNNRDFTNDVSPVEILGTTYRGLPVWDIDEQHLITSGQYSEREDKDIQQFGAGMSGKWSTMSARDFPRNVLTGLRRTAFGRTEFQALRRWFMYLRGRQKSFWVSTGRDDFTVESTVFAPSAQIDVNIVNYTNLVFNAPDGPRTRRNIVIEYVDGTKDYRRITASEITAGVRERLTLDANISQDWSADTVKRCSFLVKRRLNTDNIDFLHEFYEGEVDTSSFGMVDIYDGE